MAQNFSNLQQAIDVTVTNQINTVTNTIVSVNTSLGSRINAAIQSLETRLDGHDRFVATPNIPVVSAFNELPPCSTAALGVITFVQAQGGCNSVYVCLTGGRVRQSYTGPPIGSVACNPAADCGEAAAANGAVGGTYHLGTVGGTIRTARCEASGLEAGSGTASSPGLSCESIYTHYPAEKLRGPRVYQMHSPEGHGAFTGFPARLSSTTGVREGRTYTCTGTRDATQTYAIKYGASAGADHRYNYYMLPGASNRGQCSNGAFGDPAPGRTKYCYCGMYARASVAVKCNPNLDTRVSLTGLVGWWRAENYPLASLPEEWPSLNPAVLFGRGPSITNRVATVENPQGWSREARTGTADNNAHAQYNGLVGRSAPAQDLASAQHPGFFPNPRGTKGTGVNFGSLTNFYAICTTARYLNDRSSRGRVFVANTGNWLHGHWNQRANVIHYGSWGQWNSRGNRYDWIVTCTTYGGTGNNQRLHYVYDGNSYLIRTTGLRSGSSRQFGIGIGDYRTREASAYAFGEVIIYDRRKTTTELRNLARYMTDRLKGLQ